MVLPVLAVYLCRLLDGDRRWRRLIDGLSAAVALLLPTTAASSPSHTAGHTAVQQQRRRQLVRRCDVALARSTRMTDVRDPDLWNPRIWDPDICNPELRAQSTYTLYTGTLLYRTPPHTDQTGFLSIHGTV